MNKYNVYTVFTYVNVTEVTARNEKSAINKIRDMAETTNIFSQKIPSLTQTYRIEDVRLIERNIKNSNLVKYEK